MANASLAKRRAKNAKPQTDKFCFYATITFRAMSDLRNDQMMITGKKVGKSMVPCKKDVSRKSVNL
jgi:hypothetical protein